MIHGGSHHISFDGFACDRVPDGSGFKVCELSVVKDKEGGFFPDLSIENAHDIECGVMYGKQGHRAEEEVYKTIFFHVFDINGEAKIVKFKANDFLFVGQAHVCETHWKGEGVVVVVGIFFEITAVGVASVGFACICGAREDGCIFVCSFGGLPCCPEDGKFWESAPCEGAFKGDAEALEPKAAGIAVDEDRVSAVEAALDVKEEGCAVEGRFVGGEAAGDGAIGDGVGDICDELV